MSEGAATEALSLGSSTDCRALDVSRPDPQKACFICCQIIKMFWALGTWGQRMRVHSETQRCPSSAVIHGGTAGIRAALVLEALGKETVREEAVPGKEKKKKEEKAG